MIEALIVIGGVIGIAAVGLFVSGRMTRWWSSALYALITAALAVLMVSGFYALDATNPIAVLWYARVSALSVVVALTCLYLLSQELTRNTKRDKLGRFVRIGVLSASIIAFILSLTPLVFRTVYGLPDGDTFIDISWGTVLYILFVVGALVLIGYQVVEEMRRAYRRRYGVLDVRFVVVRTFAYLVTLFVVVTVFYGVAFILAHIFVSDAPSEGDVLFGPVAIVSALAAALILQPTRNLLNKAADHIFYKDNYSINEFVARINQALNSTNDLRTLLERLSETIATTLRVSQAFFFVNLLEGRYMTAGTKGHSRVTYGELQDAEIPLNRRQSPLLISHLDSSHPVRRMMASHRLGLVMPLYKGEVLIGFLCLGRPRTVGYTSRDLRALRTIADELTIAIQNALSVDEVRKLNDTLEQRISAATRELRASNSQLQRLDEAKDEFISMASHQLRTPLTSIKGYLSMLIEGDVGEVTKEQKHLLNEAFVGSERMVRLIGDFLNVSRLQTGKFVIDKHPVDLALLVQREIDALEQNAAARGMKFVYKRPKDIPVLQLDENKIQQVAMNFLDNAIYYSKEKSKITVSLKKVGDTVEFKVIDTGIGVPKSEQAHLFSKFFRATNARRARPDGTGVGLFLAKKVVRDHGGTIVFESKEGKGSTFGFRLPIPKAAKN